MMGSRREPSGGILCLRTAAAKGAGKPSGRADHGSMRTLPIDRGARLLDTPPHFVVGTVFRKGPRMSGTTITGSIDSDRDGVGLRAARHIECVFRTLTTGHGGELENKPVCWTQRPAQ